MIRLDLKNLLFPVDFLKLKYSDESYLALEKIAKKRLDGEIGFLDIENVVSLDKIEEYKRQNSDFKSIVVLGIGGSALGAKAVIRALYSEYHNDFMQKKIYFLDNVDPDRISALLSSIELSSTKFIVISKSGGTIETIAEYGFFWKLYEEKAIKNREKHFTIIAGKKSKIYKSAEKKGIEVFDIPENIGGRFSLLSYVGLVPLALYGVKVTDILDGYKSFRETCFTKEISENPAMISALIQTYSYFELGKNIKVFFPYIDGFKDFGAWFVQLIGESLGKQGLGMTPTFSVGVTDQHSLLQLYGNGPNDKLICFIEKESSLEDFEIKKYTFGDLLTLSKYGTEKSLTDFSRLNYTIKIDKVCEFTLGELILFYEMETAILGEIFYVNTYNQPWVEVGKNVTKQYIKEKFGNVNIDEDVL